MGSTPAARTILKFRFSFNPLNKINGFRLIRVIIRLSHVVGNMGEITVKPEQKPEHLAELKKMEFQAVWPCVPVFWGKSIRSDGQEHDPDRLAQRDRPHYINA